jgi:hypothetical protein
MKVCDIFGWVNESFFFFFWMHSFYGLCIFGWNLVTMHFFGGLCIFGWRFVITHISMDFVYLDHMSIRYICTI